MPKEILANDINKNSTKRIYSDATPVATNEILLNIDPDYENAYFYLEFSDSANFSNILDMSTVTGTVTITVSENKINFGSIVNGTDIDCSDPDYPRPNAAGAINWAKATATVPVGGAATHWRLVVARY
jgi:hypothetical protein